MKTKNIVIVIIACLIAFIIGIKVQKYFNSNNENNFDKQIISIFEYENELLESTIYNRMSAIEKWGGDTSAEYYLYLKKMLFVSNYFNNLLSSKNEIYKISWEEVSQLTEHDIWAEFLYKKCKELDMQKLSLEEARLYVNLCYNVIMNKYFKIYNSRYTIASSGERIVFSPKKEVVKLGETYETSIYYDVRDLAKFLIIEFENGNIYKDPDNIYREVATKKGLNIRKGMVQYIDNGKQKLYPFEFSFYVE